MSTTGINTPGNIDSAQSESGTSGDLDLTQKYTSACDDILDPQQEKLPLARETLPPDLFTALGEQYILYNLEIEDIKSAGKEFFHHPNVTAERVELIFFYLSNEEIEKKGFEELATMSVLEIIFGKKIYDELSPVWKEGLSNLPVNKLKSFKTAISKSTENFMAIGLANLKEEGMDAGKISILCNLLEPKPIGDFTMIVRGYTPDEIKELGARLVTMSFAQIALFPDQYDTLEEMGMKPDSMTNNILLTLRKNFTSDDMLKIGYGKLHGMPQPAFRALKTELLEKALLESSKTPKS